MMSACLDQLNRMADTLRNGIGARTRDRLNRAAGSTSLAVPCDPPARSLLRVRGTPSSIDWWTLVVHQKTISIGMAESVAFSAFSI